MSQGKSINVTIEADGTMTFEVNGCTGTSCETLTEALLRRMGTVEEVIKKPEYFIQNERPDYLTNEGS